MTQAIFSPRSALAWLYAALLTLLLGGVALARTDPLPPDQLLKERAQQVMAELKAGGEALRSDEKKVYDLANRLIFPLIDFEAMGKLTLGKHWRRATPEQRRAFIDAYKKLLVRTYAKSLRQYANQDIIFLPEKTRIRGKYATVYSEFVPGNGQPNISVVYSLRLKDGQWKAYDVTIDGLSLVKNYRTSFSREIADKGLDALIHRLQEETRGLG